MHAVIGSYIKTPGQLSRVYTNSYIAPCNSYLYMHPFRMLAITCYLCRKQIYTTSYTERAILMRHTCFKLQFLRATKFQKVYLQLSMKSTRFIILPPAEDLLIPVTTYSIYSWSFDNYVGQICPIYQCINPHRDRACNIVAPVKSCFIESFRKISCT